MDLNGSDPAVEFLVRKAVAPQGFVLGDQAMDHSVHHGFLAASHPSRLIGRQIRQREERLGKLERDYARQMDDCQDGDRRACDRARASYAEMQMLIPSIPAEPEG